MTDATLIKRRQNALNDLAKVVTHIYGHRCDRHEAGCACCVAWDVFDMMERMTDSSLLEDELVKPNEDVSAGS